MIMETWFTFAFVVGSTYILIKIIVEGSIIFMHRLKKTYEEKMTSFVNQQIKNEDFFGLILSFLAFPTKNGFMC